jgi:uroporphyrinogen-III synthase
LEDIVDDPGWDVLSRALPEIETSGWLILASPRAPERFVRGCRERGLEKLLDLPAAAVGPSTARAADDAGLRVEIVGPGNGAGLAERLVDAMHPGSPAVFACGKERRPELPRILEEAGHTVVPLVVYRMVPTPSRELPPLGPSLEAVVLTSPRSAALYLEGVGGRPLPCPHWALGSTTQQAAAGLGIECRIPEEPTMKSLAEELCTI